jgi:hypothetical protein
LLITLVQSKAVLGSNIDVILTVVVPKFNKKAYRNSRIIFAIYNNTIDFQDKQVDHIDGNVLNNSPQNLRLVTSSQNQFNRKKQKNNTSGHRNIYFCKKNPKKYTCAIKLNKKQIHVGTFGSLELAIEARNKKLKLWELNRVSDEAFKNQKKNPLIKPFVSNRVLK